ncbi:MAG: cupin domain-containing protein [Novosphingobium sp.]|nr:cupin domain-containing protein [Novosphingobium sp.]
MADLGHRRVVTGLNDAGQSDVVIDGPIPRFNEISAALAWRCTIPADNSGREDAAVPYAIELLHSGHANFAICEFPADSPEIMHATDTIDYLVILSGRVTLVLEKEEVDLGPGDFIVDRGVMHGWRNPHDEDCVAAVVNIPAQPVGKGRTI